MTDMDDIDDPRLVRWLEAAADPRIDAEIRAIYGEVERAVDAGMGAAARERPICLASGHCCHFADFGHDLFVTALETAWFLRTLEASAEDPDPNRGPGGPRGDSPARTLPILRMESGGSRSCPWLDGRLCGARAARPLGCRTFYCDPRAARWSEPLHEALHQRLRTLHEREGILYHYDEWLRMLTLFGAATGARRRRT